MSKMSFNGARWKGEGVATLLTAGFRQREHRLDEATAAGALHPEGEVSPDHRMSQRPFARVVRRLDPFVAQEHPPPLAMRIQIPARAARGGVAPFGTAQQQALRSKTHWQTKEARAMARRQRKKYVAILLRTVRQSARIELEAETLYEAQEMAQELARNAHDAVAWEDAGRGRCIVINVQETS